MRSKKQNKGKFVVIPAEQVKRERTKAYKYLFDEKVNP